MTSVMIIIATTRKTKRQTIKTTQRSEFSNKQNVLLLLLNSKEYTYCAGSGITGKDISGTDGKTFTIYG
jgi:hypothetical protein